MLAWKSQTTKGAFGTYFPTQEEIAPPVGGDGNRFKHSKGSGSQDFIDGLSNTIALSEILSVQSNGSTSTDIRGTWISNAMGGISFTTKLQNSFTHETSSWGS
jgi:hypothetical protein